MKILIVEDEQDLLDVMLRYMKREGYVCEYATTFKEGYKKINNYEYDCAILDLNLPGGDGLKLVKMLRLEMPNTATVIISARSSLDDRISGLDIGADDYLTKPFNLSELNARIKAVIRRKTNQFSSELIFGDILVYLARNKNRVVTKDSIAEHLWGDYMDDALSYDFIYAHVKNLRKKLSQNNCGDYLKTVYGVGYKFISH